MAAADVISWGIGSPASIRAFILDGLSANAGASDTTPNQFSGETKTGQALSATVTFAAVTPVGYDTATTISITGGTYSINGGAYTASAGTLSPGDTFTARNTSSGSYLTGVDTVITLDGSVSATYRSITLSDPLAINYDLLSIIGFSIAANQSDIVDLGVRQYLPRLSKKISLSSFENQSNVLFSDTRTLSPSASEDIDLSGSLIGAFSESANFASVECIIIKADSQNTHNVRVSRSSSGIPLFLAVGDAIEIKPGGLFVSADEINGIAVTASSADTITITNSGAVSSVDYSLIIIGSS